MTSISGMIFTSVVSFLIAASALAAGISIFRKAQGRREFISYSLFLFSSCGLWIFVALGLLVFWLGSEKAAIWFYSIDQIFVFISGPILAYYLSFKISKDVLFARIITMSYFVASLFGIFFLFTLGIEKGGSTYFAIKFYPNESTFFFFLFLLVPLFVASLFDSVHRIIRYLFFGRVKLELYNFFYSFVILVYLFLGFFDEQGFIADWTLVFFRLVFVAVFLTAYMTFYFQSLEKEVFIEESRNNE